MWPILKTAQCDTGIRPLTEDEAKAVAGGDTNAAARKAGKGQHDYLVVTMSDILISSY